METTKPFQQPPTQAKNKAYKDWQNDPLPISKKDKFKQLQYKVQTELPEMQNKWWQKAERWNVTQT